MLTVVPTSTYSSFQLTQGLAIPPAAQGVGRRQGRLAYVPIRPGEEYAYAGSAVQRWLGGDESQATEWLSPFDLFGLGYSLVAQAEARKTGALKATQLDDGNRGSLYVYQRAWVDAWLAGLGGPSEAAKGKGPPAATPTPGRGRRPAAVGACSLDNTFRTGVSAMLDTCDPLYLPFGATQGDLAPIQGAAAARGVSAVLDNATQGAAAATGLLPRAGAFSRAAGPAQEDLDPIAAWEQILARHEARGLPRAKAISSVVKTHPEAHRAYLDAYNARHNQPRGRGPAAIATLGVTDAQAIELFEGLVASAEARGLPRAKAISSVVKTHPAAHHGYLAAYNRARPQSRFGRLAAGA